MKDSEFLLLCANIAIAPYLSRASGLGLCCFYMIGFGIAKYLGV